MQTPKTTWFLFNIFRLTALVFMLWALVAQFVALASDIKEQSGPNGKGADTPSLTTLGVPSTSTRTSSSSSLLVASSSAPRSAPTPIRTLTATSPTTRITRIVNGVDDPTSSSTTLPTVTRLASSGSDALVVPLKRGMGKRAGAEPTSGTHGLSSIPTSPGGVLFAAVSRLIMVLALAFLILAQLGLPEMWLYRHTPILGPQSTPLWLGVAQIVIAVENLRVYSINIVWTAHAALLVIGMALLLMFLARRRKLPKSPPPHLYFSHLTRLLFFRPAPPCYLQLLDKPEGDESMKMKPASGRSRGLQVSVGDPEIGVVNDNAHTDVRQGGYPTFARGGLSAPGPQIPVGRLDPSIDNGQMRGFTARPPTDDTRSVETGDAFSGVADDESRASSLAARNASVSSLGSNRAERGKRKPAPLGLEQSNSVSKQSQDERQRSIDALRAKLSGRLERKASESGRSVRGLEIGNPVLQRSTSALARAAMASARQDDPSIPAANGSGKVLPSIPKRSNTAESADKLPTAGSAVAVADDTLLPPSENSVETSALHAQPAVPPKSPAKSIAGSLYSSILPWTRPSRPNSPPKPDTGSAARQPVEQALMPPVRWPQRPAHAQHPPPGGSDSLSKPEFPPKPRPQRVNELSGNSRSASPAGESTLARSNSGSGLLKKALSHRKPSPTPLDQAVKRPTRSDSIPSPRSKPTSYKESLNRQASLSTRLDTNSPLSTMIDEVKAKKEESDSKRETPIVPGSPSPPASPPARPMTTQSMYPNPALRSSMTPLQRADSTRSARSARTAMGVRFDLEKRHSSSSESLLSPDSHMTPTPRSAGFRIPGTKLTIPFPGTPRNRTSGGSTPASSPSDGVHRTESDLILAMNETDDDLTSLETSELEAARPESIASQSSNGSALHRRAIIKEDNPEKQGDPHKPSLKSITDRAGLPKRSHTIVHDVDKKARRSHMVVLGGGYLDGGGEPGLKLGHRRRPSSISIDLTGSNNK